MKEAVARSGSSTVEIGRLSESVRRDAEEQEPEENAQETRRETRDKKRNRQSTPKNQTLETLITWGPELRKFQAQRTV
ncbi:hypothetical protein NDU88_000307 [Pleurodeles waltl]|uniref:Uncharacterized protein n=1 Tax=Pleurodeles waltl TaxID=8319 RepID=A0AAV7KMA1_PLEWA|nr:hypothetical protein NDU88_000305 [Pleurodeles waltl]KAJ1079462.1 hypothetical protein NDU88_000307 [Pleurodeles waltl]